MTTVAPTTLATTLAPTTTLTTVAPTTSPPDWWEVDSLNILLGAISSGNIGETRAHDNNYLVLEEISGVYPTGGFRYVFDFENIPGSVSYIRATMEGRYEGNIAHDVRVYAFNYTIASYVELDVLVSSATDITYAWADLNAADYVSGGQARVEILHLSNGNSSHLLYIDQLILEDRSAFHTTVMPTTTATTAAPTTMAPTTFLTTLAPTTAPIRVRENDEIFNCKANNGAGILFVETYIEGVMASPSYGLDELELYVETYITGFFPLSALYTLEDLELNIETEIKGQSVTNDNKSNWVGWSKIGEADFTIDEVNDAGFRPMSWSGYVYNVMKLDKNVVIYGSGGVTLAIPVNSPMATFGFKELSNVGVKNKTAMAGDEFVHYYIDIIGNLCRVSTNGIEVLGYEEYLLPLVNPVLTWDKPERRLYISSESTGYIYNEGALTGGYANLTGLYRSKSNLNSVSSDTVIADPVEVVTDIIDFRRRGLKSIEIMQLGLDAEVEVYVAVDYKYRKDEDFKTTQWYIVNNDGVAHPRIAGEEFRFRFKTIDHGSFDLSYVNVGYKFIDHRFTRDARNRVGGLDDY